MKNVFQKVGVLSFTAVSGMYLGSYLEMTRTKVNSFTDDNVSLMKNFPALPIFGTVSAAVPAPYEKLPADMSVDSEIAALRTAQVLF